MQSSHASEHLWVSGQGETDCTSCVHSYLGLSISIIRKARQNETRYLPSFIVGNDPVSNRVLAFSIGHSRLATTTLTFIITKVLSRTAKSISATAQSVKFHTFKALDGGGKLTGCSRHLEDISHVLPLHTCRIQPWHHSSTRIRFHSMLVHTHKHRSCH